MNKRVAILQSNYIPWKGYFDIINSVDEFIFHDDLQYTTGDWRNRNKIKTKQGVKWLTIPCGTNTNRLICEVELKNVKWQKEHWKQICINYSKTVYWEKYKNFFEYYYLEKKWDSLSEFNQSIIIAISKEILGIKTIFKNSIDYNLTLHKAERVIELLLKVGADYYLSGPAAKSYLDEEIFKQKNIKLEWMDYSNYKEYNQLYPPFEHGVSIIDLIFNCGENSKMYLKSFYNKNLKYVVIL